MSASASASCPRTTGRTAGRPACRCASRVRTSPERIATPEGTIRAPQCILAVNGFAPGFGAFERRVLPMMAHASLSRPPHRRRAGGLGRVRPMSQRASACRAEVFPELLGPTKTTGLPSSMSTSPKRLKLRMVSLVSIERRTSAGVVHGKGGWRAAVRRGCVMAHRRRGVPRCVHGRHPSSRSMPSSLAAGSLPLSTDGPGPFHAIRGEGGCWHSPLSRWERGFTSIQREMTLTDGLSGGSSAGSLSCLPRRERSLRRRGEPLPANTTRHRARAGQDTSTP